MQVADIMSSKVICVSYGDTVRQAAQLMLHHDVGALPVVQNGSVCGMLTDRDIVLRCVQAGEDSNVLQVQHIMTPCATMVRETAPVSDAVRMMSCEQVRRLPVVRGTRLVGMVSLSDTVRQSRPEQGGRALMEICAQKKPK